ncbi:unnamed protein product [Adineta ricciae]|uniref:Uncharacterized protein n=1 Tax=Adineta ricciae TaxID=249248 RepID=A0A816EZ97_ADIRI|nr:unnamed protein product [Adineta ricciae]CAF1652539.1 unnamed protein product [Adineta ricciae]
MGRFQPVLPYLNNNISRRRGRTWQILGLIVLLFLGLTFIAVRYLPNVVIDPVAVLTNRDFKDIFVPPIPRPPVNWPNQDHDHAQHLVGDQSRLKSKIQHEKDSFLNLDEPRNVGKVPVQNASSSQQALPVEKLTATFSHMSIDELQKVQSAQMRREKVREVDKYEYHSASKGGRSGGYGPPALPGTPPSPYLSPAAPYYDGFGQVAQQGKMAKFGKYGTPSKSLYAADPMQQAMLLPPQSPAAIQAQAAAMMQMQQYMQGQGAGAQFGGILPPIQMPLAAAQQAGLVPPQVQPYYGYGGQQVPAPYFDPNSAAFQQQGAFAPYQQPNFYDPAAAAMYAGPYGYMPAAY